MRRILPQFIFAHVMLAALVAIIIFMPNARQVYPYTMELIAIGIMELFYEASPGCVGR